MREFRNGYRLVAICPNCLDEIHSSRSGEYKECACGKIAIDQTEYYCRQIGSPLQVSEEYFEELDERIEYE